MFQAKSKKPASEQFYEDFISILSPKEVSLDSRVREKVNENMARPSASTFNEAQSVIYNLMARDSYPRYISSPAFRELMREKGGIIVTNSTDFSWTFRPSDLPTPILKVSRSIVAHSAMVHFQALQQVRE
ncbi:unnamed protein product [Caenorhabditis sp. 36 PRJEB53466]|nr:unnamed protein product [Caenorhabditis sp. 36 PRJEB53466]